MGEIGQSVQLNVEEELRLELEHAQTLLLHTEELTVLETALKPENAILMNVQLTVDTVLLEIGQSVLLNVEEELRLELEHAQTLLLQTEELTVLEKALKLENA